MSLPRILTYQLQNGIGNSIIHRNHIRN